jgi:hypothetical protein
LQAVQQLLSAAGGADMVSVGCIEAGQLAADPAGGADDNYFLHGGKLRGNLLVSGFLRFGIRLLTVNSKISKGFDKISYI